ncbi:MAG: TonB-dependent receptor [Chitinophagaceae bacterium]|nr:TonB-dependent receptor [Chitinophagaceae bacterium]
MHSIVHMLMLLLVLYISQPAWAQSTIVIEDAITRKPVADASFAYGVQKGQSNVAGQINIRIQPGVSLHLTHIAFQALVLNPEALAQVVQEGRVALQPAAASELGPVAVYGLRARHVRQTVSLTHGDWVQHDAGQVLQQVSGFGAVRKSASFGADPVFRGFSKDQLTIVNDGGLTAHAACPNRMDPPSSQVMINQVQEIEVLKGPHSFRYGPGMGAVINFKSTPPVFTDQPDWFGRFSTGYESNGQVLRTEGMAGMSNRHLRLAAVGSYSEGNDYKDGSGTMIPAQFSRGAAGLQAAWQLNERQLLQGQVSRNFARNTAFPTLAMDLLSDDTWMTQVQFTDKTTHKWYQQWHTQVYASWVDHSMGNKLRPTSASMLATTHAQTANMGGRTEWTVQRKQWNLVAGLDYRYESANGLRTRQMLMGPMAGKTFTDSVWQNGLVQRAGTFAEYHLMLGAYKLAVSARADVVQGRADQPAARFAAFYQDLNRTDVNISVSAGISRNLGQHWQAGAWLGRGVRSAGILERYVYLLPVGVDPYEMLGNPQLSPEANHQADLRLGYKHENTKIELNGFVSVVHNYISSVIRPDLKPSSATAPGVRQYINISQAHLWGFELLWQQQLGSALQQQMTWQYTRGANADIDQPLPEIPPMEWRYQLEASVWQGRLQPYGSVRYAWQQNRNATQFGEKPTDSFVVADAGVKASPWKMLQLSFAVTNLLDATYREHLSRYMPMGMPMNAPGRSFVLMAAISW